MTAAGYRFTAEYLIELQEAVAERLEAHRESAFVRAANEYTAALAVALERAAGHPTDPPSAV